MPTLSIIIPVYNSEKYLKQCLDSILAQAFDDFEILLIDDGSTDFSGKLCDEYASRYNNIYVFHEKNRGVSAARNKGIERDLILQKETILDLWIVMIGWKKMLYLF